MIFVGVGKCRAGGRKCVRIEIKCILKEILRLECGVVVKFFEWVLGWD